MLEQQLSLVLHNGVKQVSWERKCLGQFFIEKNSDYKVSPSRLRNMTSYEQKPTKWQCQIHQPVSGDIQSCVIIWGTSRQHVEQQMVCTSIPPIKKLNMEDNSHVMSLMKKQKRESATEWQVPSIFPVSIRATSKHTQWVPRNPSSRSGTSLAPQKEQWMDVYLKLVPHRTACGNENLKALWVFTIWLKEQKEIKYIKSWLINYGTCGILYKS